MSLRGNNLTTHDEAVLMLRDCEQAGPASEEVIAKAETQLGVRFPRDYREFLQRFGATRCRGFEIAGLSEEGGADGPPLWCDVVMSTIRMRRVAPRLPAAYLAVSDDGGDYKFYLDTARCSEEGSCPVIALGPGVHGVEVARDFWEFLARGVRGSLEF